MRFIDTMTSDDKVRLACVVGFFLCMTVGLIGVAATEAAPDPEAERMQACKNMCGMFDVTARYVDGDCTCEKE